MANGGPVSVPFFKALRAQWEAANLRQTIVGGYYNGDPPEGPDEVAVSGSPQTMQVKKPYMVVNKIGEGPTDFTNSGQYDKIEFEITVVGTDDLTDLGERILPAVEAATKSMPAGTTLDNGIQVALVRPGAVRYDRELNYREATLEYVVRTGKQR